MDNALSRIATAPVRIARQAFSVRRGRLSSRMFRLGAAVRTVRSVDTYWQHYAENEIVHAAVTETARALIGIPFVGEAWNPTTLQWDRLPAPHELNRLLERPHPAIDRVALMDHFWTQLVVTGNSLLWKRRGNGAPRELWVTDTRHVGIRPDPDKLIGAYVVTSDTLGTGHELATFPSLPVQAGERVKTIDPRDILHLRLHPDPDYPLWGLSPISAALDSIDADNAISEFIIQFFQNGAVPAFLFTSEGDLTDEEIAAMKRRWEARQGGVGNAWSLAVIEGTSGKLDRLGLATGSREIGLHDLRADLEARILAPMNVPPIVVGAVIGLQHATYSNYGQARTAQYEENTEPLLRRGESVFTHGLAEDFAEPGQLLRIVADTDNVTALEEPRTSRSKRAMSEYAGNARSQNETRAALQLPPRPGGDVFQQPLNIEQVPAGDGEFRIPVNRVRVLAEAIRATDMAHYRTILERQVGESEAHFAEVLDIPPDARIREWALAEIGGAPVVRTGERPRDAAARLLLCTHRLTAKAVAQRLPGVGEV